MLGKWREQIDMLDRELIALLEQRLHTVEKIGQFKLEQNRPVLDEKREQEQLIKWQQAIEDNANTEFIISILLKVVEIGRLKQNHMTYREENSHEISLL